MEFPEALTMGQQLLSGFVSELGEQRVRFGPPLASAWLDPAGSVAEDDVGDASSPEIPPVGRAVPARLAR